MASLLAGADRPRGAAVLSRCLALVHLPTLAQSQLSRPGVPLVAVMVGQGGGGVATEFVQGY